MPSKLDLKRRLATAVLGGMLGMGLVTATPMPAFAQESDRVAEDKVPAPVLATARTNVLDATNVAYRKFDESGRYQVNYTTPQNLRLQLIVDREGRIVEGPQLAPNQPANAPNGAAERERLMTEWNARVRAAQVPGAPATPSAVPPAPVPSPVPAPPTTPGGVASPAARPISTEVRAADLPAPVIQSLDRFTTGSRNVNYYRQTVEDRQRYQAVYTAEDGSRREVTVADNGSLMAGPLVVTAQADDRALQNDRPDSLQLATSVRAEPADIPARAMDAISRYVKTGSDVRYRRDTYADGSIGYTAHWIQTDNSRRYFVTVAENGDLRQTPKLSVYQPAADPAGENGGTAVAWADLPDRVQKTLEPLTRRDAKARYFKQTKDNKVSYGSIYHDNGNEMWVRVDEAGETIVNPVSAKTGRPIDTNQPAPAQASGRLTPAMLKDRVVFADLPKPVQEKVLQQAGGAKDVVNMRHTRNGRPVFHSVWTDAQGRQQELFLDERGEAVPASRSN